MYYVINEQNNAQANYEEVYEKLDKEYIKYKAITKDNIKEYCINNYYNSEFYIDKIYSKEISEFGKLYFVYGRIRNFDTNNISKYGYAVKCDNQNRVFSIFPYDYLEEKGLNDLQLENDKDTKILEQQNIEKNEYNEYKIKVATDEQMAHEHFTKLKSDIKFDLEYVYSVLDEEYKQKKYKNYEEFENSIKERRTEIITSTLQEYKVEVYYGGVRYTCMDQNGNYYIFDDKGAMQYSLILDNYTLDSSEFINKYNNLSEQQKVAVNIDKFIKSINDKSYTYAYNCLADSFKNNYFKTREEFETYIKENFYGRNYVQYKNFETEGDLYTYTVIIKDEQTNEQKSKTFIMQLGEGTEFVLSFNR